MTATLVVWTLVFIALALNFLFLDGGISAGPGCGFSCGAASSVSNAPG